MFRRSPVRTYLGALVPALIVAATFAVPAAQAIPETAGQAAQQPRNLRAEADAIMGLQYRAFIEFKRTQHPAPFNWSDDGCSGPWGIKKVYQNLFNGPCQLHDFGYRNYGNGLKLGRDENTRGWIDGRLLTEMRRLCNTNFKHWWQRANKATCHGQAGAIWTAVRHGGRGAFYG